MPDSPRILIRPSKRARVSVYNVYNNEIGICANYVVPSNFAH
jgi:hypothetical protein